MTNIRNFHEQFVEDLMEGEIRIAKELNNFKWEASSLVKSGEMSMLNLLYDLNIDAIRTRTCFRSGFIQEIDEEFNPNLFPQGTTGELFKNCIFSFWDTLVNWKYHSIAKKPKSYSLGLASPLLYYTNNSSGDNYLIMGVLSYDCAVFYNSTTNTAVNIPFKELCNIEYIADKIDEHSTLCGFTICTYKGMKESFNRYVETRGGVAINQKCRYNRDRQLVTTLPLSMINHIILTNKVLIQLLRFTYLNVMWIHKTKSQDEVIRFLNRCNELVSTNNSYRFTTDKKEIDSYKKFIHYLLDMNNVIYEYSSFEDSWLSDKSKSRSMNIDTGELEEFKIYLEKLCGENSLFDKENLKEFYMVYEI